MSIVIAVAVGTLLGLAVLVVMLVLDRPTKLKKLDKKTERMLDELGRLAREHPMTDDEREAQRRSFAFGNLKIDRPELTEEEFNRIVDNIPPETPPS